MPLNPYVRSGFRIVTNFSVLTFVTLGACATHPRATDQTATRIYESRIAELTSSLTEKDEQISRLKKTTRELELEKLRAKYAPASPDVTVGKADAEVRPKASKTKPSPARRAAKKPTVPDYIVTEADFETDPADLPRVRVIEPETSVAIADSRHELLHYYFDAMRLIEERKYDAAIAPLTEFLRLDPEHVYADHAQFLIAKSHFLNKEYELSVFEAKKLEKRFPFSLKVPESLYVRGLSYFYLGQNVPARKTLENLVDRFPSGPFSEAAAKKLAQLKVNKIESPALLGDTP